MDELQIKALIDAMAASDLAEMEFSQDGWTLRLVRRAAAARNAAAPAVQSAARATVAPPSQLSEPPTAQPNEVRAPLYGVVHLQPTPQEPPFVVAGQAVKAGQTLCVIEAMKVFNEVRAACDGTVNAILVVSGQEVEAGQPLLRFA